MPNPFALIIEEDINLAYFYESIFNEEGYHTQKIHHGLVAYNRLTEITPDIILLDLLLPVISGSTILKKIREDHRLKDTRVIIITDNNKVAAGFTGTLATTVLMKPINEDLLRMIIQRFANKSV